MRHTLIIARMDPGDADAVAQIFRESDSTPLPHLVGVRRRTLFRFHDLYLHLIEADADITAWLDEHRDHPLYAETNRRLHDLVRAYAPTWSGPADAMAQPFYVWEAS